MCLKSGFHGRNSIEYFQILLVFLVDLEGRPESRRVDSILRGRPKKNVDPKMSTQKMSTQKKVDPNDFNRSTLKLGRPQIKVDLNGFNGSTIFGSTFLGRPLLGRNFFWVDLLGRHIFWVDILNFYLDPGPLRTLDFVEFSKNWKSLLLPKKRNFNFEKSEIQFKSS